MRSLFVDFQILFIIPSNLLFVNTSARMSNCHFRSPDKIQKDITLTKLILFI